MSRNALSAADVAAAVAAAHDAVDLLYALRRRGAPLEETMADLMAHLGALADFGELRAAASEAERADDHDYEDEDDSADRTPIAEHRS